MWHNFTLWVRHINFTFTDLDILRERVNFASYPRLNSFQRTWIDVMQHIVKLQIDWTIYYGDTLVRTCMSSITAGANMAINKPS